MADIFNVLNHKWATMDDDDGEVHNLRGEVLGRVDANGTVWSKKENKMVGEFYENGDIYQGGHRVGKVYDNGEVRDYENVIVGRVTGGHIKKAGAALFLLVR